MKINFQGDYDGVTEDDRQPEIEQVDDEYFHIGDLSWVGLGEKL